MITPKEIRREASMFETDMIMGITDRHWLLKVCGAQNRFLHQIADELEAIEQTKTKTKENRND